MAARRRPVPGKETLIMDTRLLPISLILLFGALAAPASDAEAQDVDPQKAAACMQAVDSANYEQVLAACPEVLAVLPEDHPYYAHWSQTVNYAYSLQCEPAAQAQQWDSVITYCQMAVQANPQAFILNYYLGLAHMTKEDWANAGVSFSTFLDGVQGNREAASQLSQQITVAQRSGGIAYARANAIQDALPLLQAASRANPQDVEIHFRLGNALLRTGDNAGGERALDVYIEHAPAPAPAIIFIVGQLAYNSGNLTKADALLSRFLEAQPSGRGSADAHYMLGQALQASDEDRAITHYQGFLAGADAGDARVADANFALGTILYNRDDCSNAEQYYQAMLEAAPDHANAAQVTEILASIAEGGCESGL